MFDNTTFDNYKSAEKQARDLVRRFPTKKRYTYFNRDTKKFEILLSNVGSGVTLTFIEEISNA